MTTEDIRETYRALSEALTSAGLGWIVHQVEDRIREGRPVEREARVFKDEEPGEQASMFGADVEAGRRPGKPMLYDDP